ncbi:MAG: ABC transporter substrate-binding protein [Bacteroidales bacterium]|nr:ABC transporter substrate-binding protein [Bacteroidales bacterium]MDY6002002.1 ABC transporter substrate-binding protein [Candidatus Cryptobacteroides sp.]
MNHSLLTVFSLFLVILAGHSCGRAEYHFHSHEASFLNISEQRQGWIAVSISPFDGSKDTLDISRPVSKIIAMSTSYVGFLDALGCDSVICGVSGVNYVSSPELRSRSVADVGYEANPDYEKIMALHPDVLLTYQVSGAKSQFLSKLEALGIPVFVLHEHLESNPLARASYIRFFGALTGKMAAADSILSAVSSKYEALADSVRQNVRPRRKVLVNIPYNDSWFIPGRNNYLSQLVCDAGGEVLGSMGGKATSSSIFIETAYALSKEADLWLNVGWCQSLDQLRGINPLFENMLTNIQNNAAARGYDRTSVVWNDNLRLNPRGGNDFWESGVVRPDLVMRDLVGIFGDGGGNETYYRVIR